MNPIAIVGGGLSGLAAAVQLASRRLPVVLLEQKPYLGGRTRSFTDAATHESVDNGQHLLVAGYTRTLAFLTTIGSSSLLEIQPRPSLLLHHPEKGTLEFTIPLIPPPFNLVAGILRSRLLGFADRMRLLRGALALRQADEVGFEDVTIGAWLDRTGQTSEIRRCFWEPLAVSIMNETCERGSAKVFAGALRRAFLSSSRGAALAFPRVGLSELFAGPALRFLAEHGASVRCSADVRHVRVEKDNRLRIHLRSGKALVADACILSVPPAMAAALMPREVKGGMGAAWPGEFTESPIVSIHLWFERDFMPHQFLGLIGRRVQWVFNRRRIAQVKRPGGHVSAVVSAAYGLVEKENEKIVRIAIEDLRSVYGDAVPSPVHTLVIREKKATVSLTPVSASFRPDARTSLPNFFLAGDWTATGYPATIEGAIVSGEKAASLAAAVFLRGGAGHG